MLVSRRHKRESWQIWENYASAALRAGAPMQAVQGLGKVLQLSEGQRLPLDTARALVDLVTTGADAPPDEQQQQQEQQLEAEEGGDDLGSWLLDLPGLPPPSASTTSGADAEAAAGEDDAAGAEPHASEFGQQVAAAEERARKQWVRALGQLLKEAVNQPCCSPPLWGCLGKYYAATGQEESAKEALLKQVRALKSPPALSPPRPAGCLSAPRATRGACVCLPRCRQVRALTGTSYKSDEKRFVEMAEASVDLAQAYVRLYTASAGASATGAGAVRELAAARMHLRGVLKQCEQAFGEHEAWRRMDEVLQQVLRLEEQAVAASKSKPAA